MTMEAVVNLVLGSGLKDLSIRVSQRRQGWIGCSNVLAQAHRRGPRENWMPTRHQMVNDIRTAQEASMSGVVGEPDGLFGLRTK